MTDSTDTVVRIERTVAAPPDAVYRAWLDPDLLVRWLCPADLTTARAEVDARVGGRHRVWQVDPDGTDVGGAEGVFVALDPGLRIVLRWHFVGPDRETPPDLETLLTVAFAPGPAAGTTHLTLVHERLGNVLAAIPELAGGIPQGWASVLDKLATELEN